MRVLPITNKGCTSLVCIVSQLMICLTFLSCKKEEPEEDMEETTSIGQSGMSSAATSAGAADNIELIVDQASDDEEAGSGSLSWFSNISDFNQLEDEALTGLTAEAIDSENSTIAYSIDAESSTCDDGAWAPMLTIDGNAGTLSGAPSNSDVGQCSLTIIATSSNDSISQSLLITVENTNDSPQWQSTISDFSTPEDQSLPALVASATDIDGDSLTYLFDHANMTCDDGRWEPALIIDSATGIITGTPRYDLVGVTCSIIVIASDGTAQTEHNFNLTITETNPFASLTATSTISSNFIDEITPSPLSWASATLTADYFIHDSMAPDKIIIKKAGNYLLTLNMPVDLGATCTRCRAKAEVYINQVAMAEGFSGSSYIRNASTGNSKSSNHLAVTLQNLNIDDEVQVFVGTASSQSQKITTPGTSLYMEYLGAGRSLFTATAIETNDPVKPTILNQATPYALKWNEALKDAAFTHDDTTLPEEISLEAGDYIVHFNLPIAVNGTCASRKNVRVTFELDGLTAPGATAESGYIRCLGGDDQSSINWSGLLNGVTQNQKLTVKVVSATTSMDFIEIRATNLASIYIEKIDSSSKVLSLAGSDLVDASSETTSNDWNTAFQLLLKWDVFGLIDFDYFAHDLGNDNHQITITEPGDYLLVYSDHLTSNAQRAAPIVNLMINGVAVPSASCRTHYIRNATSHVNSSCSLVKFIEGSAAGDVIEFSSSQDIASGTVTSASDAQITLIRK
jgi:hypothetical protein